MIHEVTVLIPFHCYAMRTQTIEAQYYESIHQDPSCR